MFGLRITYRFLKKSDAHLFREICLLAAKQEPSDFSHSHEELASKSVDDFLDCFLDGWIVGAFSEETLQGIAGLFKNKNRKGILWGLYTTKEFRRQGIARHMIEMLLKIAKQNQIEHLSLFVGPDNLAALNLYNSLGFKPYCAEKQKEASEIFMYKKLTY